MEKISTNFILELPLKVEQWQYDLLDKRFETLRKIYNSLLSKFSHRYYEMSKMKEYKEINDKLFSLGKRKEIREEMKEVAKVFGKKSEQYQELVEKLESLKNNNGLDESEKTALNERRNQIIQSFDLSEKYIYGNKDKGVGWKMSKKYIDEGINGYIFRMLCYRNVWKSINGLFSNKKIHFKKYGEFNTIYGQPMSKVPQGIKYRDGNIIITKFGKLVNGKRQDLILPLKNKRLNEYEAECLNNTILYLGVTRKFIRGKFRYYVQFTIKGLIPSKINKETGKFRTIGHGDVGLDIGTSSLAIVSDKNVELVELADKAQPNEHKIRLIQRKLDRSRRKNNPNKFNEDGTINRGNRDKWVVSKNYIKLKNKLRDYQRKLAAIRKMQHEILANNILSMGDNIYIETMRWKGLQKRAKETTISKSGRINRKKRFGHTIGNRAPSMFMTILDNKLKAYNLELNKINTNRCKASQYNHILKEFNKKPLSARWSILSDEDKIQRDLYSAFLIQNVNENKDGFNDDKINQRYNTFKSLHDAEIERLSKCPKKLLSSMGIKKK